MKKRKLPLKFYAPKYWGTWTGLALLRLLSLLPYNWMKAASHFLGKSLYPLAKRRTHIIETNIRLCFPELSAQEQHELALKAFISSIMAMFEIALSWWGSQKRIIRLHEVDGMEHLEKAAQQGKGVILLVSHFTTMEIAGAMLNSHIDNLDVVYKRSTNELLEWFIHHKRLEKCCAYLTKHKSLRQILRAVKDGHVLWYAPDQDFGRKDSVFAPFMGVMTNTLVSTQRLAKLTNAPVVPFYVERKNNEDGYIIHFSPKLEDFPTNDEIHDATVVNRAIEKQVRQTPEQYLWAHRRFKTRPKGEADVYTK